MVNAIQNPQFYQTLNQLSVVELEELMQQIIELRKQKLPTILTQTETELLRKINAGILPSLQKRYQVLFKKRQKETLTEVDYEELLALTSYIENHNVQRLSYIIELAKIRNTTVDEIIASLELKPRLYVV
jgi:hypothetical protein